MSPSIDRRLERRGPAGFALAVVTLAGALGLVACAPTSPTAGNGGTAGSGGTSAADAASAPASGAVNVPRVGNATTAPRSTTVGAGRNRVVVTSEVLDKNCAQIVQPWDLDINLVALTKLAAESAIDGFKRNAADPYSIPRPVRDEALRMNWLPQAAEERYGQAMHKTFVDRGEVVQRDSKAGRNLYPVADELLKSVLAGVSEPHPYRFTVYVRGTSDENAIALPGGIVYIDAPLLAKNKQDKAQFALGHEIAHVLQRHETRILQARIIDSIALGGSTMDLVSTLKDPFEASGKILATMSTGRDIFQRHFAGQELQADACSVRILEAAYAGNLTRLDTALGAFIAALPPDDDAPAKLGTSASTSAGSRPATEQFTALLENVGKPIDRHPHTKERRDNLIAVRAAVTASRNLSTPPKAPARPATPATRRPAAASAAGSSRP